MITRILRRRRRAQPAEPIAGDPSALTLRLGPNDCRWETLLGPAADRHWIFELDAPDLGEPFDIWLLGIGHDPDDGFETFEYLPFTDGDAAVPNAPPLEVRIQDVQTLTLY